MNVSHQLLDGMSRALDLWGARFGGDGDALCWVLRIKVADTAGAADAAAMLTPLSADLRATVSEHLRRDRDYWDNVRYANLDRVTQLWGVVVNALRVVADSPMASPRQRAVFDYPATSLLALLRAARERMEVADQLHHCFKPMPAPECQALAALLNVHLDATLDVALMCRLVRLLDAEGPLSEAESADLDAVANTQLVAAAFHGLRGD